jgi:hypothetical protein
MKKVDYQKLFNELSVDVRGRLNSTTTSDKIYDFGKSINLPDDKISLLAEAIGDVVMGVVKTDDLPLVLNVVVADAPSPHKVIAFAELMCREIKTGSYPTISERKSKLAREYFPPPSEPGVPTELRDGSPDMPKQSRDPLPNERALGFALDEDGTQHLKGVLNEDRDTHFYIVGASGSGKTKFMETIIEQDILGGVGFGVIDPHSDLTENTKGQLYRLKDAEFLRNRVIVIDPTDKERTICFNPLEKVEGVPIAAIANEVVDSFRKIWGESWGPRLEDLFKNSLIALIENDLTLAELPLFLTNAEVREKVLSKVEHPTCREYFERFNSLNPKERGERMESTLNKVDAFLLDYRVRDIFLSSKSSFNMREAMDNGKILLVKLDTGQLKSSGSLLGSLLLAKIQTTAFTRTDTPQSERVPFYLFIDEFQNFATENFIATLAEARKYRLALTLAHQNLAQLPSSLRASILSNCGLQTYFRISRADADILAKESLAAIYEKPVGWESYIQSLQELPRRICVVKNKIGGGVIKIETMESKPPHEKAQMSERDFMKAVREADIGGAYLRSRDEVRKEYQVRHDELIKQHEYESFREKKKTEDVNYEEIIKGGENDFVEFKSSIRWDYKQGGANKSIEYVIAKAISAFMNVRGGRLFVGVNDSGEIIGIEKDYALVHHKNKDGFLLQLTQIVSQYLGKEFHQYMSIKIIPIKGKEVCVVEVANSKIPVFLKNGGKEEFYIRASASSQPMSMREANEYIRTHFHRG